MNEQRVTVITGKRGIVTIKETNKPGPEVARAIMRFVASQPQAKEQGAA